MISTSRMMTMMQRMKAPMESQSIRFRSFSSSSGSDDDFKPKYHSTNNNTKSDIQGLIKKHVNQYPILLYMKGTPQTPQCGFSQTVVRILHAQGVDFDSVNVLEHAEIREGIKEFRYVCEQRSMTMFVEFSNI